MLRDFQCDLLDQSRHPHPPSNFESENEHFQRWKWHFAVEDVGTSTERSPRAPPLHRGGNLRWNVRVIYPNRDH